MKNLKRIFSAVLTLVLAFCMISAVSAAATKGSITVKNATVGKKYEIYKIFDLTHSGTKVAYTIDSDWSAFFESTTGSKYIIDLEKDQDGNVVNPNGLNAITVNGAVKYINITDKNISTFAQEALTYATSLAGNDGEKTATTKTEGVTKVDLVFDNLDLGYYLVYPEGASDKLDANGSICSLDSTLKDVEVTIKAKYPEITKTVEDDTLDVGNNAKFTVTGQVPDTTGFSTYTYKITDTMSTGLSFDATISNFKLTIDGTEIKIDENENVTLTYDNNGFVLTFEMTKFQDKVGKQIVVTYEAKVTEAAINNNAVKNKAFLEYSNDPKNNKTMDKTPNIEIPVYTSAIKVLKVDGADKTTPLAGAEFVLTKEVNGVTKYYQAKNANNEIITNVSTTTGVVTVNWVSRENATVLVTDANGNITFGGIENGTYNLVETKAPEGFNLLTKPEEVKVGYNEEGTNIQKVSVIKEATVENNAGTEIPSTGGMGTTLFVVIGSLLAIASAVIFVTNKRIAKEM